MKRFFAQPQGHMNIQKIRRAIRRHRLEAFSGVMIVAVIYRKGQKQLKKIAKYLKSTLARPPLHDRAYPEELSTASLL